MDSQNNPKQAEKTNTTLTSPLPPATVVASAESPPSAPPLTPPPPPPPPPFLSSSPSHEFSFTVSFHAPNSLSTTTNAEAAAVNLSKSSSSPLDYDLSPADDIFFNGHLLPLQVVSHRPSDVSMQRTIFLPPGRIETDTAVSTSVCNGGASPKSFPFFRLRKWMRGNDGEEERVDEKKRKERLKKKVLDFVLLWKKYTSLLAPFHFLKEWKEKRDIRRSAQVSFSGDGRRRLWQGRLSAPASIRTSPANSGLLVTPTPTNFSSEELQNAIQAAIVHCKSSIAVEEN